MARRKRPKQTERNNYQDMAEEREFEKGFRDGQKSGASSKFKGTYKKRTSNDPQWYFKQAQLLNDVASFSYATPLGSRVPWHKYYTPRPYQSGVSAYAGGVLSEPGLLSLKIAPTFGINDSLQSPANLAALNMYSFVRYKNSGARNYDASDLFMYMMTMDSLYAAWNWMKRIYGEASVYSQTNKYMPRAWLLAEGVNPEDLVNNLANFRAFLNSKVNEIKSFCVPATFTLNVRHSWMFSNIYKDSETDTAQQYIYVPAFFYQYGETTSTSGGQLLPSTVKNTVSNIPSEQWSTQDLMTYLNSLLAAANYSEDIGIMSGDILKAYGEGNLFTLSQFDADYRVDPVFSKEVLSQIENADVIGFKSTGATSDTTGVNIMNTFKVSQNMTTNTITSSITWNSGGSSTGVVSKSGSILNFHWENPSPEDVIVASRLKVASQFEETSAGSGFSQGTYSVTSCGSEVVLWMEMYYYSNTNKPGAYYSELPVTMSLQKYIIGDSLVLYETGTDWDNSKASVITAITMLSAFDWHPIVPVVVVSTALDSSGKTSYISNLQGILLDADKYTFINNDNIYSLNELALLSEFNVPN